jgi:hypothetical protein
MEREVDRTPHLLHPLFARFIRLVGDTLTWILTFETSWPRALKAATERQPLKLAAQRKSYLIGELL